MISLPWIFKLNNYIFYFLSILHPFLKCNCYTHYMSSTQHEMTHCFPCTGLMLIFLTSLQKKKPGCLSSLCSASNQRLWMVITMGNYKIRQIFECSYGDYSAQRNHLSDVQRKTAQSILNCISGRLGGSWKSTIIPATTVTVPTARPYKKRAG